MARRPPLSLAAFCAALALAHAAAAVEVSGPYLHHNLAVYLVHGPDGSAGALDPLEQALERGQVVVYETGSVNELAIENRSADRAVFVQAGDIVKGGRQDRVFSQDLVLKPKSGRVPIGAFCVESGRWQKRGAEASDRFTSSKHALSSKELKLAARRAKDQGAVWRSVEDLQGSLGAAMGAPVESGESATSLQLSLENRQLAETKKAYVGALAALPERHANVVGVAIAINGELSSAEVYATTALLRGLWPKLLDAAATEAVASVAGAAAALAPPATAAVTAFLAETRDSDAAVYFETRTGAGSDAWLHRSYIAR
jgi:hypothetical protein